MKRILYCLVQCTWGILQTTLGLFNFMLHIRSRHYFYHGAVITEWNDKSSVSLGMFVFVTKEPYFYDKLKNEYTMEELSRRLLVHEYGHTIQSCKRQVLFHIFWQLIFHKKRQLIFHTYLVFDTHGVIRGLFVN